MKGSATRAETTMGPPAPTPKISNPNTAYVRPGMLPSTNSGNEK
jgi:hypothetical protein